MKIILISQIAKLGTIGDVINVRDGYAKNFLIPQKKAIFYSAANYKQFEARKQEIEAENATAATKAEENKKQLAGKDIIILENASDDGRLYGAVTTNIIAGKVNEIIGEGSVSKIDIILSKTIKEIGVYNIKVDLHSAVLADVRVVVSRSESEVAKVISDFEAEKNKKSAATEENVAEEKVEAKKSTKKDKAEEVKAEPEAEAVAAAE